MEYKGWMRKNGTWLCEHTPNLNDFMRHLYSARLLSGDVKSEIEAMASTNRQRDRLYDHLVQWGPERVPEIITCAEEAEMDHVANKFSAFLRGKEFSSSPPDAPFACIVPEASSPPSLVPSPFWFGVKELGCLFIGRTEELDTLHRLLTETRNLDNVLCNVIYVSGMGGIGKTSLAKKYARKSEYAKYYDSKVIWIEAENEESLRNSFSRLAASPQPPVTGIEARTPAEITASVYEALKSLGKPPLIIFDNAEDFMVLKQFLPKLTNVEDPFPYILVTTRCDDFTGMTKNQLRLKRLQTEDSVRLIRDQLQDCSVRAAGLLAERLDGFPLIIQQALSYIKETYIESDNCIRKYLDELERSREQLLDDRTFQKWDDSYTETAWTVCGMTLAKIRESCEPANELIKKLSILAPETSQRFLKTFLSSEMESELKILAKHSMITLHKSLPVTINTHRIVQQVVQRRLEPNEEKNLFKEIADQIGSLLQSSDDKDIGNELISQTLNLMRVQLRSRELLDLGFDYMDERLGLACISEICAGLIRRGSGESFPGHQSTLITQYILVADPAKRQVYPKALGFSNELFGQTNRISAHILYSMALHCLTSERGERTSLGLAREASNWLGETNPRLKSICRIQEARILSAMGNLNHREVMELAAHTYIECLQCFGNEYFERLDCNSEDASRRLIGILKVCQDGIDLYYDCRAYGNKHHADLLRQRRTGEDPPVRFEVPPDLTVWACRYEQRRNAGHHGLKSPSTTMDPSPELGLSLAVLT